MMMTLAISMTAMGQEMKCQHGHCEASAQHQCEAKQGCQGKHNCEAKHHCVQGMTCRKDSTGKRAYDEYKVRDCLDFDVALGFNIMTSKPEGANSRFFGSNEFLVGLRYKYTPKNALQSYSTGLWIQWNRYTLDNKMFYKATDNVVALQDFPAGVSSPRSRINIFSLSVPLFFTQKLGRESDWSVTLGPVVNFNVRGRVNNEYDQGDDVYDITTKGINYRPVTIDLMGMLQYKGVGIYCKYSPMSVLKKDMGPQFRSLTLGVFL